MAFWGAEVKPKKPFALKFHKSRRLHVSQAILGDGSSRNKVTMHCCVDRKKPILICCLRAAQPCSSLNIEFSANEYVIFRVSGPRSIHLSGFFYPEFHPRHSTSSDTEEDAIAVDGTCQVGTPQREQRIVSIPSLPEHSIRDEMQDELVIETIEFSKETSNDNCAESGDMVQVFYKGTIRDTGDVFGYNHGKKPYSFVLGECPKVIEGWHLGINGMRVGETRRIIVPPSLGYGSEGAKRIPGDAWLMYEISLVDLEKHHGLQ